MTVHRLPSILRIGYRRFQSISNSTQFLAVSEEIRHAIASKQPVVALESTLLTHGLPPDRALSVGRAVESVVRENGAIPATIAVFDRKIRVGLQPSEFERLIEASAQGHANKAALRDLPFALNCHNAKRVYGTTVSATSFAANLAGIRVFATGGTGGVHRGGEKSMDISSDLMTLGTIPVAVVSAGVKSILDIPRTLEVLESKGVCVACVGTNEFPAFFTRSSGVHSPGRVDSPEEAAQLLATSFAIRPSAGVLLAVPVPEEFQAAGEAVSEAIEVSLKQAKLAGISGASVTPFMLERVRQLTGDYSLEANIALVMNNAKFAAQTTFNLSKLNKTTVALQKSAETPQVAVVGGSNMDTVIKMQSSNIKTTKDIYPPASYAGSLEVVGGGGVGRNVVEAIGRLSVSHVFLTAVSADSAGQTLMDSCPLITWRPAPNLPAGTRTANYIGVLNANGELLFGVADMDIHKKVTASFVESELGELKSLKVICSDGNIEICTLKAIVRAANKSSIPFWYEPTDLHKSTKIVDAVTLGEPVAVISPNLSELKAIYYKVTGKTLPMDPNSRKSLVECAASIRRDLSGLSENWLVKMGRDGVIMVNQETACHFTSPVVDQSSIVSVSGAGDSCAGTVLYLHYLKNWSWKKAVLGGLRAVELSLASKSPIPETLNAELFENDSELHSWAEKIVIDDL